MALPWSEQQGQLSMALALQRMVHMDLCGGQWTSTQIPVVAGLQRQTWPPAAATVLLSKYSIKTIPKDLSLYP